MHDARSYVLVLGAGGKVSAHTVPLLVGTSHHVSALAHNPKHAERLAETGATVIIQDLTKLDREGWARLLTPFDVVVWSAGAGGGDPERTYAVDRDAAMVMIDALEELGEFAPLLINVSYAGAQDGKAEDDGSSWYAYVEAKKAVDLRLLSSEIDQVILGPTLLTDAPATGINILNDAPPQSSETARELVAQVIAEIINRGESFDQNPFEFENGNQKLQDL
ncbi:nucleoside-diphosphate sugar epimerase [Corynebacterium sp. HMSC30G07]|uniref:NAD(P)H-binding protein n=1 Tax=Corynebacterium TaxID=1716 RepID=UPI0008A62AF4|nr:MULTISPECIES: NAD(P)H-binding protein [Corynebacterium]OFT75661.1 nucleoside-diphosphate sugar epimerase [Corynebacterium sp. HMSC30G07]